MKSLRCLRKARREFEGQSAPQLTSYHQHTQLYSARLNVFCLPAAYLFQGN
jgi:hypothetical protein